MSAHRVPAAPRAIDGRTDECALPPDEADTNPSQVRLTTRPHLEPLTNEGWARTVAGAPRVTMSSEALKRLPLDHRAGFVISLMDGSIDLEMIVDLCGMERDDALGLVRDLYESGVVEFSTA
ncbi:MAG: hypothetical protein ABSC94_16290 [Polyangiaceae bacterium]